MLHSSYTSVLVDDMVVLEEFRAFQGVSVAFPGNSRGFWSI